MVTQQSSGSSKFGQDSPEEVGFQIIADVMGDCPFPHPGEKSPVPLLLGGSGGLRPCSVPRASMPSPQMAPFTAKAVAVASGASASQD